MDNFRSPVKHYDQVPEAVEVLRLALSKAEDHSVTFVSIGFLQNLAGLLDSGPDWISPMKGQDLVRRKVKLVAIMGGVYPKSKNFSEFNFSCGSGELGPAAECQGSSKKVVELMPPKMKMVFSGFEVGERVEHGAIMTKCLAVDNPCRRAYIDYLGPGVERPSWDPLTLLYAVRNAEAVGCHEAGQGGTNFVNQDGFNHWVPGTISNQSYLVLDNAKLPQKAIDQLLCSGRKPSSKEL